MQNFFGHQAMYSDKSNLSAPSAITSVVTRAMIIHLFALLTPKHKLTYNFNIGKIAR